MANHGHVRTRRWMTPERIDKDLVEILQNRFKDKFSVVQRWDKDDESMSAWRIGCTNEKSPFVFTFWLKTRRTMEFRQPHTEIALWAHWVIQNELVTKYGGAISSQGLDGRTWGPATHISYEQWVRNKWKDRPGRDPRYDEARKHYLQKELEEIPEALRGI